MIPLITLGLLTCLTSSDPPTVFHLDTQLFAILRNEAHLQFLPCLPAHTLSVFVDLDGKYESHLDGWLRTYSYQGYEDRSWKYVNSEQGLYDWLIHHVNVDRTPTNDEDAIHTVRSPDWAVAT